MLCHLIEHLRRRAPFDFTFAAVTFNPMFPEFNLERTAAYAARQGWEHHQIDFPMAEFLAEKQALRHPCALCSRMRRGKLYGKAVELNCTKLALGHNLDDLCASFLMSLCRGQGLKTMAPVIKPNKENFLIIRPLAFIPEDLIREVARTAAFPDSGKCSYEERLDADGDRAYFMRLLGQLELRIPHLRQNMLHSLRHPRAEFLPSGGQSQA